MAAEYLASNEFPGDGVTTLYNVSFKGNRPDAGSGVVPYLNTADVKAQLITPATSTTAEVVEDVPIVYVGPNQFRVTPAAPVGKIVRIYRATQDDYALVDYQSLQTVSEADLDLSNRQLVFIVQESRDLATRADVDATSAVELAYEAINTANDAATLAAAASASADNAVGLANAAVNSANLAVSTANAAAALAQSASNAAADAIAAANSVVGIANGAVTTANAAQSTANGAVNTANTALAVANGIASTAQAALDAATLATSTANNALSVANGIAGTAQAALDAANAANVIAEDADDTANNALSVANGIASTANTALTNSNTAITTANGAVSTANAAQTTANAALARSGGTMTGPIVLAADATAALHPVTKQQFERSPGYAAGSGVHGAQRNVIHNGEMVVWNRGASHAINGTQEKFTADRWRVQVNLGSGGATTSVQLATEGEGPFQASRAYNYARISGNVTGASGYILFRQPIIDLRKYAGNYTLSFWARRSHAVKCGVRISQVFGDGGSAPVSVGKTFTFAAANTWQLVTLTFNLPSMSGKTHSGTARLELSFEPEVGNTALGTSITGYTGESVGWGSGSSAGTFDITCVQLEAGTVATPFEMRPYQDTLLDCLRYFSPTQRSIWGGYGAPGAGVWNFMPFFTKMVRAPTRNNISVVEQANAVDTIISSASELGFRTTNAVPTVAGFRVQADYNADADYYSPD
ncbi:tail fiber protein [Pseudomonas phage vB_PpuP-Kurepalu-1]